MKKTIKRTLLALTIILGSVITGNAQEIGVRFGDVSGGNVAIDGIFSTGKFSRIHGDISFGDGMGVDLIWDFIYRPLADEAFNWYLGVGPYAVFDDPFWLGAAGEIGLEYRFNSIPVSLSIDWRPELSIVEKTDFHPGGFGINLRYVIGR
ncbi:hypothetical protein [Maribellus sp. YY47]|uniref:hypothetical protein n=1 Tax=Maribellus sp. YY47 TaxID=2929486 RepID=UPI0020010A87|nr:hypothetical protein [Maribellus sp. YY47]MCK3684954.1 hypothetical protein [Maribellus sp. YY47]